MRGIAGQRATEKICVLGRGRWGSSLVAALRSAGFAVSVAGAAGHLPEAGVYWLCVPDDRIEAAARRMAKLLVQRRGSMRGLIVVHSSGVMSSKLLVAVKEAGAHVGSVHPLMSFPTRKVVAITDTPFAVEADTAVRRRLFALVRTLGGSPFSISAEGKALYHAAAVMASPLLVGLAEGVSELAMLSGIAPREASRIFKPLLEASLSNFLARGGQKSFSGPFVRGDVKTVSLHLDALGEHPALRGVYRSLALYALTALPVKNKQRLFRMLKTD